MGSKNTDFTAIYAVQIPTIYLRAILAVCDFHKDPVSFTCGVGLTQIIALSGHCNISTMAPTDRSVVSLRRDFRHRLMSFRLLDLGLTDVTNEARKDSSPAGTTRVSELLWRFQRLEMINIYKKGRSKWRYGGDTMVIYSNQQTGDPNGKCHQP